MLQGLLVGAVVTAGFLGLFALIGLPVSYGVGAIAGAVPWAGLATGAALAFAGSAPASSPATRSGTASRAVSISTGRAHRRCRYARPASAMLR